ncbi:MAG TPA: DUF805 domain-containing protein [Desulfuromonadales bacterium]|nr:DUF805 domain-containing protein [Desulfuromonadales bacterium]
MRWYIKVLKNYAVFRGRAGLKEYWCFVLFTILINLVLAMVDSKTGNLGAEARMGLFGSIYNVAVLIPTIAASVRRLHDTNRTGWWTLLSLIPIIGTVILLVYLVQDSDPVDNRYGRCPKG